MTTTTTYTRRIGLDSLAIELLHHIAYFAATSNNDTSPPTILLSLHLTSKRFHAALSPTSHPHFYARLFRSHFDSAALYRRFPSLNASALHNELIRRWTVLRRIRRMCSDDLSSVSWSGRRYRKEMVLEDLMTMYLMLIENDGRNVRVLEGYAKVGEWLRRWRVWRMVNVHEGQSMPPDSEEVGLYWWVEWLLMDQGERAFRFHDVAVAVLIGDVVL